MSEEVKAQEAAKAEQKAGKQRAEPKPEVKDEKRNVVKFDHPSGEFTVEHL